MTVATRKVCVIGDFAVGKTSTVTRFVRQTFSPRYLTTVGVKIDTCPVRREDGSELKLVIWDIAGGDGLSSVEFAYLRGSAGLVVVADGTRATTVDSGLEQLAAATARHGEVPFVLLINKSDRADEWEVTEDRRLALERQGIALFLTSALTGENVAGAVETLARRL